jgi:hypothetical protein
MNVFVIGAGFTKAVFPDAPLNSELFAALTNRSPCSSLKMLREQYKTEDIEIALTRLDADLALSHNEDTRMLRRNIESELASYFSSFCASDKLLAESEWLTQLIDDVFKDGDVAVSLNYDCALEGALDCRDKWSPNGGYGSSIENPLAYEDTTPRSPVTVLKIHGSSNFVIAPYADKPSSNHVSFNFYECFFPRSAKNKHFGYGVGRGRSYVIAPSYVKIPTVEMSYLMLDALKASSEAKNLILIGCSLRPEDSFLTVLMTSFLHQLSWPNRKIIIVDPAAESISDRLKGYWGVDVSNQILPIHGQIQFKVVNLLEAIRDH